MLAQATMAEKSGKIELPTESPLPTTARSCRRGRMIRTAACCLALALSLYVFAVGLYSVLPTQPSLVSRPTRPAADDLSLAVLADVSVLPTATGPLSQSV